MHVLCSSRVHLIMGENVHELCWGERKKGTGRERRGGKIGREGDGERRKMERGGDSAEAGGQRTEDRGKRTEDRGQRIEGRGERREMISCSCDTLCIALLKNIPPMGKREMAEM